MILVQNQSGRKYVLREGVLEPKSTIELEDERADLLTSQYPELVKLEVIKVVEKVVPKADLTPMEEKSESELNEYTRAELMSALKEKGIKFEMTAKKVDLINLLKGTK